jgi:hypothetical protein
MLPPGMTRFARFHNFCPELKLAPSLRIKCWLSANNCGCSRRKAATSAHEKSTTGAKWAKTFSMTAKSLGSSTVHRSPDQSALLRRFTFRNRLPSRM